MSFLKILNVVMLRSPLHYPEQGSGHESPKYELINVYREDSFFTVLLGEANLNKTCSWHSFCMF